MKGLIFVFIIAISLFATSCFEEEVCSPNPCLNDGVCSEAMASYTCECLDGFTGDNCEVKECATNSDCLESEVCEAGACVEKSVGCQVDSDCLNGQYCSDRNVCIDSPTECQDDTDCLNGYHCELMDCADSVDCGGGGVCAKDPVVCEPVMCNLYCENGFKKDADGCEICVCVEGPNECRSDDDCNAGKTCFFLDYSRIGTCVDIQTECQSDLDCLNGSHCELMDCADESGVDCGGGGICVKDTNECRTSADCATGEVCQLVNCEDDPNVNCGGMGGVCVPYTPECTSDADCGVNQHCELLDGCFIDETGELNCPQSGVCVDNEVCPDVMCELYCENGFKINDDGCEVCECVEAPMECQSDAECFNGFHCELPLGCFIDETGELNCPQGNGICVEDSVSNQCNDNTSCQVGELCVDGLCIPEPTCDCYEIYAPVCGVNNITYGNDCQADCANVEIAYVGECR